MKRSITRTRFLQIAFFTFVVVLAGAEVCAAQQESGTRGIVAAEFVKARPAKPGAKAPARPAYKTVSGKPPAKSAAARELGVTIWRLRASVKTDSGPRLLVQEAAETISWTPERVAAGALLREGDADA